MNFKIKTCAGIYFILTREL